jgi:hypothetical protein
MEAPEVSRQPHPCRDPPSEGTEILLHLHWPIKMVLFGKTGQKTLIYERKTQERGKRVRMYMLD